MSWEGTASALGLGKGVRGNQVKNMGCIPGRMNNLSKDMDTGDSLTNSQIVRD